MNGTVYSIALFNDDQFAVAGELLAAGPLSVNHVARWTGSQWQRLGTAEANGVTDNEEFSLSIARDIKRVGSRLYVAGRFSVAGDVEANNVAYWESGQWHSLGNDAENGTDSSVVSLLPIGSQLFIGGSFTNAGSVEANRVALWTGSQWQSLGNGADNGVGTSSTHLVYDLASYGTELIVAGRFSKLIDDETTHNVVRWTGSEWLAMDYDVIGISSHTVWTLGVSDGSLYAGGNFSRTGFHEARRLARWDGDQWHPPGAMTGTSVDGPDTSPYVFALTASSNGLLVGGRFSTADGIKAINIARFTDSMTEALGPDEGLGLDGSVNTITQWNDEIYVGGNFHYAGGVRANHLARFDGDQWHALVEGPTVGVNSRVEALTVFQDALYVGGYFSNFHHSQPSMNRFARWDGEAWHKIEPWPSNHVNALQVHAGSLYVGTRSATLSDGTEINRIARYDGSQWHALANVLGNGVDDEVHALASHGGLLYIGGDFDEAGGETATGLAIWDGVGFSSLANGPGGRVRSILVRPDRIIVGGSSFIFGPGDSSRAAAVYEDGSWQALDDTIHFLSSAAFALAWQNNRLLVGGSLYLDGQRNRGLAALSNGTWRNLGPAGNNLPAERYGWGAALALLPDGDRLLAGGSLKRTGMVASSGFGIFNYEQFVQDQIFRDRFE